MKFTRTRFAVFSFVLTLLLDISLLFFPMHSLHSSIPLSKAGRSLSDKLSDKLLRLHIIADNDSDEAQAVKLLVRDAVCDYLSPPPEGIDSKEEVCDYLNLHMSELVTVADNILRRNNCSYRATASIGRRFFPLKTYGAYTFPPGEYDALCITLGSGQGQNWWCLAFPSLCLLDGTYAVTDSASEQQLKILLTDEEYEAILIQEPKIRFRFRLFEWLKGKHK